jgi:glycosyltransferase involved in cell wall biosynthesis
MMVTIAIPTYNRLDTVKKMADSLYRSDLSPAHNIRVYDDCSSEFGTEELKKLFPTAASITRNKTIVKADTNMYLFYKDFLSTSDEYLFNADSDLIFQKDWLTRSLELIKETQGVLSTFNAISHPAQRIVNSTFCVKKIIGAAGTLFTRKRIEELMQHFTACDKRGIKSFDWKWSTYFTGHNIPVYCVNDSLVQHIGYSGQNALLGSFEFGKNFTVDSPENGQVLNDLFAVFVEKIAGADGSDLIDFVAANSVQHGVFDNIKAHKGLGGRFIINCCKMFLSRKGR